MKWVITAADKTAFAALLKMLDEDGRTELLIDEKGLSVTTTLCHELFTRLREAGYSLNAATPLARAASL